MPSFNLTAATTPGTPAKLLGVDAGNNPIAVLPPSPSNETPEINFQIGGQGTLITTGVKKLWRAPFSGLFLNWTLLGDASGSIDIGVWKKSGGVVPTVADKISATAPFRLTSAQYVNSAAFTGWAAGFFTAGDILAFNVESIATLTRCDVALVVQRST